jgi:hypothetical protein
MPVHDTDGTVTLERGGVTYTGRWSIVGNKLFVSLGHDEEPALLGMFEKEPEILARMLLAELVERRQRS